MDNQQQPVRDQGLISVASHVLDDSDIRNHRSSDAVYIGLHVPKRKHRRKRHKHRRVEGDKTQSSQPEIFKDVANPAQRVQFLLGEEEDEEHKSHDLFCEMEELFYNGDQIEWKESARWIKFEEDVEEGAERWGKPHVASLSFHSLLELRRCLENGTLTLDLEAEDLPSIVNYVVNDMVIHDHIKSEHKGKVLKTLLMKHKHVGDKMKTLIRRNISYMNLSGLDSSSKTRLYYI